MYFDHIYLPQPTSSKFSLDKSKPFCTSKLTWNWSNGNIFGYDFFQKVDLEAVSMLKYGVVLPTYQIPYSAFLVLNLFSPIYVAHILLHVKIVLEFSQYLPVITSVNKIDSTSPSQYQIN